MSTEVNIPKIFFQTSKNKLDQYIIDLIKYNLTDEWVYTHYLDSDILEFFKQYPDEEFPNITEKFLMINGGEHKADLFRYYHIYVKGGVFMDSDAMLYAPIDTIIKHYKFFSVNSSIVPNSVFQGFIGAEPKNPLIYKALKSFYDLDLNNLRDYHYLCKEMYNIYKDIINTENSLINYYTLYNEVADNTGDKVFDIDGRLIIRHFWRNKVNLPNYLPSILSYNKLKPQERSKNLVYFCVFYNSDYLKLLNLLLISLKMYSKIDTIDLLIITSDEFKYKIYDLSCKLNLYIDIQCFNFTTIFQAACARLHIFDYEHINSYNKILYLDTDIIIKGYLTPIFNNTLDDVVYGLECGTIGSPSFGNQFFDFYTIKSSTTGINSGTLLFNNSPIIKELFSRMRHHIHTFTLSRAPIPYCMDQPFINYHAIKDNLYNNKLLNPIVSLFEGNDTVDNYDTSVICHFSYPIGNFGHKYKRMTDFLNKILNIQINKDSLPDIIGNKYTWNNGYIYFRKTYIITTWGSGNFDVLDTHIVRVYWNNHYHIMKFNNDFTKYICIRTWPLDFEYVSGTLINNDITIYGDSHGEALFKDFKYNRATVYTNLFEYAITMHRIGRDNSIINFNKSNNNTNGVFCFVYGEVDVRCHIGNQILLGRDEDTVCLNLVQAYFNTIFNNVKLYKAIIIVAVSPPTDSKDHTHKHDLPFIGTNEERLRYTIHMNKLLEEHCNKYKYIYFDPFDYYKREDGCLNYTLSDSCVHVGNNTHFLNEFYKHLVFIY